MNKTLALIVSILIHLGAVAAIWYMTNHTKDETELQDKQDTASVVPAMIQTTWLKESV